MRIKYQRKTKQFLKSLLKLSIIITLIWLVFFAYNFAFTINSIHCQYQSSACPQPVLIELNKYYNTNLLKLDKSALISKLTASDPSIKSIDLNLAIPGSISANLNTYSAIAQITTASASATLTVSSDFTIITHNPNPLSTLPLITSEQSKDQRIGNTITDKNLQNAIKLSELLTDSQLNFTSISQHQITATVILSTGETFLFNLDKPFDQQITSLKLIRNQLESPNAIIDLRFAKPTIRYI